MADPVSWFVIEPGWKVVDADGNDVGSVDEVAGDPDDDIFNGLAIATSLLGRPRYVPAEQVGEITDGLIQLKLTRSQIQALREFKEPPTSAKIVPEGAGALTRAEGKVEAPIHRRSERVNLWRRLWFGLARAFRR